MRGQYYLGTTGLLHMPSAEMQRDKTFMFGGSFLHRNMTPTPWPYHTFNYYVNITIFPWLEIAYDLTLNKGVPGGYWPRRTWGKFVNQDRQFGARLRLWKEGWWKEWMPQLVIGTNDPGSHDSYGGGDIVFDRSGHSHAYFTRYYLAATKHIDVSKWGEIGVHAALVYSREYNNYFTRPAIGANFQFDMPATEVWQKLLNGLNVMAEYDAEGINIGGHYKVWRDNINLVAELHECRYFSGGIYFKLHLR